ncbi:MAG: hypothetical protein A2W35_21665 [Chloroflexi bacterium RBG_16_57_11]|nr:MAG: hypothetical protein A2W35_21665 [Chloroflexi bacterium RBG_16_57_11]
MERFFADYLDKLQEIHAELRRALEGLPQPALDWTPGEGANSLVVIAFHTAGSERYWIGDCVAGEPSGRDREAEFRTVGLSAADLNERLDLNLTYVSQVLERITLDDLQAMRTMRDGSQVTVGWILAHVLSHTAIHVGHAQVTRQWWEQLLNRP